MQLSTDLFCNSVGVSRSLAGSQTTLLSGRMSLEFGVEPTFYIVLFTSGTMLRPSGSSITA